MRSAEAIHTHFVFSRKEYETLCKKAKQCGLSRSAFLRRLITGTPVKARPPEAIRDLYVEINKIGVNVNQIARACNAGAIDAKSAAERTLFMLRRIYDLTREVTRG